MLYAIEMQISLKDKEWFYVCVCVFPVCACSRQHWERRGANWSSFFFFGWGGETLENSHTHTHSRQLHITQWRHADSTQTYKLKFVAEKEFPFMLSGDITYFFFFTISSS